MKSNIGFLKEEKQKLPSSIIFEYFYFNKVGSCPLLFNKSIHEVSKNSRTEIKKLCSICFVSTRKADINFFDFFFIYQRADLALKILILSHPQTEINMT